MKKVFSINGARLTGYVYLKKIKSGHLPHIIQANLFHMNSRHKCES